MDDALELLDEMPFSYAVDEDDIHNKMLEAERSVKRLVDGHEKTVKHLVNLVGALYMKNK